MRRRLIAPLLTAVLTTSPYPLSGRVSGPGPSQIHGSLTIHMLLHAIGSEQYDLVSNPDGSQTLSSALDYSDRGRRHTTTATLTITSDNRPLSLDVKGDETASLKVLGDTTTMTVGDASKTVSTPAALAAVVGPSPFALQMMAMRTWHARGEPKALALVSAASDAEPVEITRVGGDVIRVADRPVSLARYTVNHLMFGREIVWMTPDWQLAAAMTFAGGLPFEAVRTEFEPAFQTLYHAGVAQEMADLDAIGRAVLPMHTGGFALSGATLIDGTGAPAIPDAVVVVRAGRIVAAGPRAVTPVPPGLPVIEARGQTLLPGLWEMHTHASGVEFGPALLAAGITTARDCGGEMEYLMAAREAIETRHAVGPRWILAGLIDAGGQKAFGQVTAETADEARAVVDRYHQAGFQQIKLYTYLSPEVVRTAASEAHRLGMSVTGHVPQALTTQEGIEAGMDQINHLNFVSRMLRPAGASGPIDLQSDAAKQAIQFLVDHHTVVDPTASWGEMASHSHDVPAVAFEPGLLLAPAVLQAKFRGMTNASSAAQMHARLAETEAVIGALHRAGVPVVAGSDTGLVGYGLHREIEIYGESGLTPIEAIQAATIVPARAMGLSADTGTVTVGKRADLILVQGDPLKDLKALRRVTVVVTNGRAYDARALWRSVGFRAEPAGGAK